MHDGMFADLQWRISHAGWDGLTSFLSLFPFVEILQAPEYSLRVLLASFQESPCVWSLLHTLRITEYTTLTPSFAETLLRFLDRREGDELPIKVLDVTECVAQERQDWGFLERKHRPALKHLDERHPELVNRVALATSSPPTLTGASLTMTVGGVVIQFSTQLVLRMGSIVPGETAATYGESKSVFLPSPFLRPQFLFFVSSSFLSFHPFNFKDVLLFLSGWI
ncbi:hypothetical protein GALMADRAFT_135604 [Galerina marginata CBS 339.88]|uniref:Uncharacterized protein n=1 Tax=Galerina marginata (strain CBS 339.88) TaxID=685588 RepID=A0A067TQN6_GALM3|nr:hypothetical protein GALMADRAFT_135604 [Galerina marginata CBS 339.88]